MTPTAFTASAAPAASTSTTPGRRVLGQFLLATGAITEVALEAALAEQLRTRARLGEVLVGQGVDPAVVVQALAVQLRIDYVAAPLRPDPAAVRLVDGGLAARLRALPLAITERGLRVAMADPLDGDAIDALRFQTGRHIEAVMALPGAIESAIATAYDAAAVDAILMRIPAATSRVMAAPDDVGALRRASEAPPVIALVELLLRRAVQERASDLHIEPVGVQLRVRARVDGVLRALLVLPHGVAGAVVSRLKVMSKLDISVRRKPQDGRGAVTIDGREIAMRVSTLPAQDGEKVVVRLLDADNAGQTLDQLGFDDGQHAAMSALLRHSHGVLLITGPTGSGKTTTLYACLGAVDRERHNVVTLEDPVEYRLPGLTQVQVHRKAGLGFAPALRAVLRQDPDIIMVGELRDPETVETALAAALTGHLVLSTLHTNDAASAAARLGEMGAAPYLVAAAVIGVVAQRLARRLCPHCKAVSPMSAEALHACGLPGPAIELWEARGCPACSGSGYRGRVGIFEILPIDRPIRSLIMRRASGDRIRTAAREKGVSSLASDAWNKVRAGLTTIEAVRPLLYLDEAEDEKMRR